LAVGGGGAVVGAASLGSSAPEQPERAKTGTATATMRSVRERAFFTSELLGKVSDVGCASTWRP